MHNRGLFITFEGMDGSGKTTQVRLLAERLRRHGRLVVESAEPGGTAIGMQVRRILLDAANAELCPTAELLLYFACRAQNVEQLILPALNEGGIVLSDRFTDSSIVYQGCGRGLGFDMVLALDRIACKGLKPDLTIFIDIDPETSLARARARNRQTEGGETRMDEQAVEFYQKVHDAYQALVQSDPARFRVINGRADVETIASEVWEVVKGYV